MTVPKGLFFRDLDHVFAKTYTKTAYFSKKGTVTAKATAQKEVASYETTPCKSNLKPLLDLLCDLCSLALTIAEIIKLCSSDLTLTNNVDVIDLG